MEAQDMGDMLPRQGYCGSNLSGVNDNHHEETGDRKSDNERDEDDEVDNDDEDDDDALRVEVVMKAAMDPKTRHSYNLSIRRFIIFLFRKKDTKNLLHDSILGELSKNEKSTINVKKKHTSMDKKESQIALKFAELMSPAFHPINLEQMKVEHFLAFLLSMTDTKKMKFRASYGDLQSALTYLFKTCNVIPAETFKLRLRSAMKGLKNTAAKGRSATGGKLTVGKKPLPFPVYVALSRWLLEDSSDEAIFAHCFLTITWNLMCRSKNTVLIHRKHISWQDDCLTVLFGHTKTDTTGETSASRDRHVYANPLLPEICCVTSLARYLVSFPSSWESPLFPGSDQYDRFRKILKRVLHKHNQDIRRLGVDPAEIGVHSIRKGAATYVCNGTTGTVSFAAVCIRAGWTMGNVKDRYIHHEAAGDHVVGRMVAGLDVMSPKYSVSPPLFLTTKEESKNEIDGAICTVWGVEKGDDRYLLMWFLLASLCKHREMDCKRVGIGSKYRGSIAFRREVTEGFVDLARIIYPWEEAAFNGTALHFTGMTQLSLIFQYMEEQKIMYRDENNNLYTKLMDGLEALEKRQIIGNDLSVDSVTNLILKPILEKIAKVESTLAKGRQLQEQSKDDPAEKARLLPSLVSNFEINRGLHPIDAWVNWWHGEQKETSTGAKYTTQAWRTLQASNMKQTSAATTTMQNLKFLCRKLDEAAGFLPQKKAPSIADIRKEYFSQAVQSILPQMTPTGRQRRVESVRWETTARAMRKMKGKTTIINPQKFKASAGNLKNLEKHSAKTDKTDKRYRCSPIPVHKEQHKKRRAEEVEEGQLDRVIYRINGRSNENRQAVITERHKIHVETTGALVEGDSITGFMNHLFVTVFEGQPDVERATEYFFSTLLLHFDQNPASCWNSLDRWILGGNLEEARVVLLPCFVGNPEGGHWFLIIVDKRTCREGGIITIFDSLPHFTSRFCTLEKLKRVLRCTPLASDNSNFIQAEMMGQASNDCAIWLCLSGTMFVLKELLQEQDEHRVEYCTVRLQSQKSKEYIGLQGRRFFLETLQNGFVNTKAPKEEPMISLELIVE